MLSGLGWAHDKTMNDLSFTILSESPDDAEAIDRLNARTFGPGRFAKSAYRLREEVEHIPELSFTARVGTLMVGSVRLSPILIGESKALLLGPLTIEPPFRGRGIGQQLIAARAGRGEREGASPGGAGRRRALLRPFRLQGRREGPGHHAGPGRSGAHSRRRACAGAFDGVSGAIRPDWPAA